MGPPSGGGKTTLCHLIPRFYDVTEGQILVDGRDVRDVTLSSLRLQIGLVQQDVFLFTGTVQENILYGNPSASEQEMVEAAKKSPDSRFYPVFARWLQHLCGRAWRKTFRRPKTADLHSQGISQNPPILILDEATSALDTTTEQEIQEALMELSKDRTTLIIAHRLSTIRHADQIIVLTDGDIQEQGTHKELLARGGLYADFHYGQLESVG